MSSPEAAFWRWFQANEQDLLAVVTAGALAVRRIALGFLEEAAAAHGLGRPLTYAEAAQAVVRSTLDVRRAATFGEAIIVIVYVPILTLAGIEGRMFGPMATTVLFALFGAFVASLTFVPVLAATFLRQKPEEKDTWIVRMTHRAYQPLLRVVMRVPLVVAAVAVAVFIIDLVYPLIDPRVRLG